MKNFTATVRKEIASKPPAPVCCRRSMLAGLLVNAECGIDGSLYVRLTGRECIDTAVTLVNDLYGKDAQPDYFGNYGRAGADFYLSSHKLSLMISGLSDPERISEQPDFFRCRQCRKAFYGGLILSCASFCDPEREARVEFTVKDPARASKLTAVFSADGVFPTVSGRRGDTSLLIKKADGVESVVALAGASASAMALMQCGLVRDYRKDLQRRSNCDMKNIAAAAGASARQLAAIRGIREEGRFSSLPDDLRETAKLRDDHPDATMAELAAMHLPPISKSGLNHRFERIIDFYGKK